MSNPGSPYVRRAVSPVFSLPTDSGVQALTQAEAPASNSERSGPEPATKWAKIAITAITLLIATVLLFARLGHYALWDDEAMTALFARGVWQTGDTSAVVGLNVVAYRGGSLLRNLKNRYEPPLMQYLAAPFAGLWPGSAMAVRFPFAIAGLFTVCIIFFWMWHERVTFWVYLLMAMGLIGNVEFWLYCRQCRYYGAAILFCTVIVLLYLSSSRRRWTVPLISLCAVALLAAHCLDYAALGAAVGIDWLIFRRKRFRFSLRDWLWLLIPQIVVGGIIMSIWNPFGKPVNLPGSGGILDRLILFWWAWRDMDRCEFGVILFLFAAPVLWFFRRDAFLLRGPLAMVTFVAVTELLSPQQGWIFQDNKWLSITSVSDVRYLATTIPLLIAVSVLFMVRVVPRKMSWLLPVLGTIAFGTNLFEGGRWVQTDVLGRPQPLVQSTLALYIGELWNPFPDPYALTSNWINANVPAGSSILVAPDFMKYPLMFHAPNVVYAWQIPYPPEKQFADLPPIHFAGRVLPDYLICFGPVFKTVSIPAGTRATLVGTINIYWRDMYRPELTWRIFRPFTDFNPDDDGIHIWRLSSEIDDNFHL